MIPLDMIPIEMIFIAIVCTVGFFGFVWAIVMSKSECFIF